MSSQKGRYPNAEEAKRKMGAVRRRMNELFTNDEDTKQKLMAKIDDVTELEYYRLILQPRDPYPLKNEDSSAMDDMGLDWSLAGFIEPPVRTKVRRAFLKAIEVRAPRVIRSLAELRGQNHHNLRTFDIWAYDNMLFRPFPTDRPFGFHDRISDWPVWAAIRTVAYWDKHPGADMVAWSPDAVKNEDGKILPMKTRHYKYETDWNPGEETEAAFRRRVLDEVASDLQRRIENMNRYLPPRQRPAGHREDHHFEWLVEYQINRLSYSQIAKAENTDRPTVTSAIKKAARLLFEQQWRWWLRPPGHGGRPRTTRS